MKKRMKKLHRSNQGFTLMELIVTMLVSSIVTAAVAGFLSMGLNYYRRTNAETSLQTESQVAELFLTELLQECQYFEVLDSGHYPAGVSYAVEITRDGIPYIVARKGEMLVFGATDPGESDVTARIQSVSDESIDKVFLARHANVFQVSPGTWDQAFDLQGGLVKLTMKFVTDGKSYTGTQTVSLRNTIKN